MRSTGSPGEMATAGSFAARLSARVLGNTALGSLVWLTLGVPGWPGARPGQFTLLQAKKSCRFLGRAISVAQEEGETVSFLIASVGEGTRELAALKEGEEVWVLGPLGNGFDLQALTAGCGRVVVVAGGVGAAPFPLLLSRFAAHSEAVPADLSVASFDILVLLGFRDAQQAGGAEPVREAVRKLEDQGRRCRVEVVTQDGSLGRAEKVSDTLARELRATDRAVICGPPAMVRAIAQVCAKEAGVRAWFSLEAEMACGVGSCHGCVISLADGSTARVCRDGPVFTGEALFGRGFSGCGSSDSDA